MRPFSSTICKGSASDTFRVKLLSNPQATHAPAMANDPAKLPRVGVPIQDMVIAPAHDAGHAERDPHVEILAEDEPRYQAGLVNNLNLA